MKNLLKNKKVIIGIVAVLVVVAITTSVILLNGKDNKYNNSDNGTVNEPLKEVEETYLVISINPKLMIHLDKDGKVLELFQLNEDAVIFTNEELKNLDLDKAIDKIVDIAQNNGYLKDNKNISISVLNNDKTNGTDDNKIYLEKAVTQLETKGLEVKKVEVTTEEKKEIEKTVENYVEKKVEKEEEKEEEKPNNQVVEKTTTKNITVEEKIPFTSITENEVNMLRGITKVTQEGQEGIKKITYKITYNASGKEISRTKVSETISKEVVNKITKIGISDFNLNDEYSYDYGGFEGVFIKDECWENPKYLTSDGYYNYELTCEILKPNFKEQGVGYLCEGTATGLSCSLVGNRKDFTIDSLFDKLSSKYQIQMRGAGNHGPGSLTTEICSKYGLTCGSW